MIAWTPRRVALRHGRLVNLSPLDLPSAGSTYSAERRLLLLGHLLSLIMAPSVDYYCPCLAASPHPPLPHLASSSYSFHPLHNLFFCEECDAVRCNRCVMVEVSGYYCPNCLFEVPSASVRAEKNRCAARVSWWRAGKLTAGVRCARNCFLCPNCRNTLSVVPSDPPNDGLERSSPIVSTSLGEPPFFLYCNHCRWDSAEVGITFEKPTGLAGMQPPPFYLYLYISRPLTSVHSAAPEVRRLRPRSPRVRPPQRAFRALPTCILLLFRHHTFVLTPSLEPHHSRSVLRTRTGHPRRRQVQPTRAQPLRARQARAQGGHPRLQGPRRGRLCGWTRRGRRRGGRRVHAPSRDGVGGGCGGAAVGE